MGILRSCPNEPSMFLPGQGSCSGGTSQIAGGMGHPEFVMCKCLKNDDADELT